MTHSCFRVFWPWPFQDKSRGRIGPCFILISLSDLLEPKVWCSDQSIRPAEDLFIASASHSWSFLELPRFRSELTADSWTDSYISLPAWRARQTLWATLGHWTLRPGPPPQFFSETSAMWKEDWSKMVQDKLKDCRSWEDWGRYLWYFRFEFKKDTWQSMTIS